MCFSQHCFRGDVFQLVLPRRFTQSFKGDEFNVVAEASIHRVLFIPFLIMVISKYLASRSANIVKDRKAEIHLIAGTFKRTGDDEKMLILLNNYPKTRKKIVNMLCWLT
jgi:anthranilate synthase component 1